MKKVLLLDVLAIIHRAYFALPPLTSSKGEPTGALYGLLNILLKLIKETKPDYIIACYDTPEQTHRGESNEDYKSNRTETDEDLVVQIENSYDFFEALSIPTVEKPGYEADDIIGTLAQKMKSDYEVLVASGDSDLLQLVEDGVTVFLPKGSDVIGYDFEKVVEKYGFEPKLLIDFKGLAGDSSDNIKGVSGVGAVTATKLIKEYGTIEEIYKAVDKGEVSVVTPRIVEKLINERESAFESKGLATILQNVHVKAPSLSLSWREGVDSGKIQFLRTEYGFSRNVDSLEKELGRDLNIVEDKGVDDVLLKKTAIALWVLMSEYTDASFGEIMSFTGKKSLVEANSYILEKLKEEGTASVFFDIEEPLIPVLEYMSDVGILVDKKEVDKLEKIFSAEIDSLVKKIYRLTGSEFNINSPKQLGDILFDKMGIKSKRKTKGGQRTTKGSELLLLRDEHEVVPLILKHREYQKIKTTYIDVYKKLEERIHTTFLQNGTETGRMSSKNPNLQNIPSRGEHAKVIRNLFIASKGKVLLSFDYSQIELRVAAILSGDKVLIDYFNSGQDIHSAVASRVFGVEDITKDMRAKAKAVNFGILYGMGARALSVAINSDLKTAEEFLSQYKKAFSGLTKYLEDVKVFVKKHGYTETLFGRRRSLPDVFSSLEYVVSRVERQAVNAPIQGTSADMIKIALVKVFDELKKKKLLGKADILLQIHDEILLEVEEGEAEKVSALVVDIMESVIKEAPIKLEVNVSKASRWGDML